MRLLLVLLALGLVVFLLGFAVKLLWIAAALVLAVWLVAFLGRGREDAPWFRR